MATTFDNTSKFDNHPAGAFAAVCCDVYTEQKPNKYFGTKDQVTGKTDTRQTVTKARIKFLTTEMIEVNGEMKPRVAMYFGGFSWGDNSKLRQFVRGWVSEIGKLSIDEVDLDALIGRSAWITVSEWDNGGGTSVSNAIALPPSIPAPAIPKDFVRHNDKPKQ